MRRFHERPEFTSVELSIADKPQVEVFTTA
jgi:hypothetical protein